MAALTATAANQLTEVNSLTGTLDGFVYKTEKPYLVEYIFDETDQVTYVYNIYDSDLAKA